MKNTILTFLVFLTFSGAFAADLDSTRQARVAVYNLMGMDTTGPANLSTGSVDFYVNQAVKKINEDLRVYRKNESITMTDGKMFYALDSVIFLTAAWLYNGDSIYGLKAADVDTFFGTWEFDEDISGIPEYYLMWGDSIGVIPIPRKSTTTVRVLYTHLIPTDSLGKVPSNYRFGIVLYATYLSAMHVGQDGQKFYSQYIDFVNSKRGVEPAKK